MCFSASASFGVSAVLIAGSTITIKKVREPKQLPFALIPLIFGVQQLVEGFVWLSLTKDSFSTWQASSTSIFLFFAEVLWPVWVPWSIWLLEENKRRKDLLLLFLLVGCALSLLLAINLFVFPFSSSVNEFHISYQHHKKFPVIQNFISIIYFMVTVLPPFFSHIKSMFLIGALTFLSYIVTKFFFGEYVISVWCFFAATISIVVFMVMRFLQLKGERKN